MKYKIDIKAFQQQDAALRTKTNEALLKLLTTGKATPEMLLNYYTGLGGLHNLKFDEFDSFYDYTHAKKKIELGQFFTPLPLLKQIADACKISPLDSVADFTCGIGGFFNFAPIEANCTGYEIELNALSIAKFAFPEAKIMQGDLFELMARVPSGSQDVIFGNPPFNIKNELHKTISQNEYVRLSFHALKLYGIFVLVVPERFGVDSMVDKRTIMQLQQNDMQFIGAYQLPRNAFEFVGVDNFAIKVMAFQKVNLGERTNQYEPLHYVTEQCFYSNLSQRASQRANKYSEIQRAMFANMQKQSDYSFKNAIKSRDMEHRELQGEMFRLKKYFYELSRHKALQSHYAKALKMFQSLQQGTHLENEDDLLNDESNDEPKGKKKPITTYKILQYCKRAIKLQNEKSKPYRVVPCKFGFMAKGKPTLKDAVLPNKAIYTHQLFEKENESLIDGVLAKYRKRIKHKIRQNDLVNYEGVIPCCEIDSKLGFGFQNAYSNFVRSFDFINGLGELSKLNNFQIEKSQLCFQKPNSILNFEQGGGKTAVSFAIAKFRLLHSLCDCAMIVSTPLAINNTWKPFFEQNKVHYIAVNNALDFKKLTAYFAELRKQRIANLATKNKLDAINCGNFKVADCGFSENSKQFATFGRNINDLQNQKPLFVLITYNFLAGYVKGTNKRAALNAQSQKDTQTLSEIALKSRVPNYRFVQQFLKRINWSCQVILDECDELNTPTNLSTKAAFAALRHAKFKLLSTGTTTRNNLAELFTPLQFLYNASCFFIQRAKTVYKEATERGDGERGTIISKSNPRYDKPFCAHFGYGDFKAAFNPSKSSVFGIGKQNQSIYNKDLLYSIINANIATATFAEIAGADKYTIQTRIIQQSSDEAALYADIMDDVDGYRHIYNSSKNFNARKDALLRINQQMQLLLRACSIPNHIKHKSDKAEWVIRVNKQRAIIRFLATEKQDVKVLLGCTMRKAVETYARLIEKHLPNRKVFVITSHTASVEKRKQIVAEFEATTNGILICTQQSLASSISIRSCANVIVESTQWNFPRVMQFYFRCIRFDSQNHANIYFFLYQRTIEINKFYLLVDKQQLNDFVRTRDIRAKAELLKEVGLADSTLDIMQRTYDQKGTSHLTWGKAEYENQAK